MSLAAFSERLDAWYWQFGRTRSTKHALSSQWLTTLMETSQTVEAARHASRPYLAIRSVAPERSSQVLRDAFGKPLNGYVQGPKSSAIRPASVMRVAVRLSRADKTDPALRLRFASRAELFAALAASFESGQMDEDRPLLDPARLTELLSSDRWSAAVDIAAARLIHDLVAAIDLLLNARINRFTPLNKAGIWTSSLRSQILNDARLRSNAGHAWSLLNSVLWSSDAETSTLAHELIGNLDAFESMGMRHTAPISEQALRLLYPDDKRADSLLNVDEAGISVGSASDKAGYQVSLDHLRAITKEVIGKVDSASLSDDRKDLRQVLESFDLVDFPSSTSNDPGLRVDPVGSFYALVCAAEASGTLLIVGAAGALPELREPTNLLIDDCDYLLSQTWQRVEPGLTNARSALESLTEETGVYGYFPKATSQKTKSGPDRVEIARKNIAKHRAGDGFNSLREKEIAVGAGDPDGGFGRALKDLAKRSLSENEVLDADTDYALDGLIRAALPVHNLSGSHQQSAFTKLTDLIEKACFEQPTHSARRRASILLSEQIREAFTIRPEQLDPVPIRIGRNIELAEAYVAQQIGHWTNSGALRILFDQIGLEGDEAKRVIGTCRAVVSTSDLGQWICEEFGDIASQRAAEHCRKFVSAKLSNY